MPHETLGPKVLPNGLLTEQGKLLTEVAVRDDGKRVYFGQLLPDQILLYVGAAGYGYHVRYLETLGQGHLGEGMKIVANIALTTPTPRWPFTEESALIKEMGIDQYGDSVVVNS